MECIFCKIIAGEIPCDKVYEDDDVLAFLDINPTKPGHTLVVPKKHFLDLLDVDIETLKKIMAAAQKIGAAIKRGLNCGAFNIIQNNGAAAGQIVPHLHFHIIPRDEGDGLIHWPGKSYAAGAAAETARKIVGAL
jgi:histidine triad (HIT) family protein